MQDAVDALRSALDELRLAKEALPEELSAEVQDVIRHTETVLDAVRVKLQQT